MLHQGNTQSEAHSESSTETDVNLHVNLITESLPVFAMKSKQIAAETEKDTSLQRVIKNLNEGWPRGDFQQYYNIRVELSVV